MAYPNSETGVSRCRRNGSHAEQKLSFLLRYAPPALRATTQKRDRVYVDLFAGPGEYEDESGRRNPGSPLRVLGLEPQGARAAQFTRAVLVNLDPEDDTALRVRIADLQRSGECRVPKVDCRHGDANVLLPQIMRSIHRKAYAFVFADPESPGQWPWASVEALKAHGHESVDLYMLFPLQMGLMRMLAWKEEMRERNACALTRFFGCEDWRSIVAGRLTDNHADRVRRGLEDLYLSRLRGLGWKYAECVRHVTIGRRRTLYHMLFASNHSAGEKIARWERRTAVSRYQPDLFQEA